MSYLYVRPPLVQTLKVPEQESIGFPSVTWIKCTTTNICKNTVSKNKLFLFIIIIIIQARHWWTIMQLCLSVYYNKWYIRVFWSIILNTQCTSNQLLLIKYSLWYEEFIYFLEGHK